MIGLGIAAGAARGISENHDRIRQRVQEQMEEAKAYSKVAKKREEEAAAVKERIMTASKTYGVSPGKLMSAYKGGQLDSLLDIYDKTQRKNGNISPEVADSLWVIPEGVEVDDNISEELNRIYGVVQQRLDKEPEINDSSFMKVFADALGFDTEGAALRQLDGRTVQGYDVDALLNMDSPVPPKGDGGRINYDVASPMLRTDKEDSVLASASARQIGENWGEEVANKALSLAGGAILGPDAEAYKSMVINDIIEQVAAAEREGRPITQADLDPSRYWKEFGEFDFIPDIKNPGQWINIKPESELPPEAPRLLKETQKYGLLWLDPVTQEWVDKDGKRFKVRGQPSAGGDTGAGGAPPPAGTGGQLGGSTGTGGPDDPTSPDYDPTGLIPR
jgi:hypothetical protein